MSRNLSISHDRVHKNYKIIRKMIDMPLHVFIYDEPMAYHSVK